MFITKNWEKGFLWVSFKEHPVKDFKKEQVTRFVVSTKEYPDYASDFMNNGSFDDKIYCIALLRTTLELSTKELSEFLKHQCGLVKDSLEWLYNFGELLTIALEFQPTPANKIRFKWLNKLVGEKCVELSDAAAKKEKRTSPSILSVRKVSEEFDIKKLKEEVKKLDSYKEKVFLLKRRRIDYLQEIKNSDEKDPFVKSLDMELKFQKKMNSFLAEDQEVYKTTGKKILCAVSPTKLAKIIHNLRFMETESGTLVFDGATSDFARMICNSFCKENGEPFSENSIRKYLTDHKNNK